MKTDEHDQAGDALGETRMARSGRGRRVGIGLCVAAVLLVTVGWVVFRSFDAISTDNAYVRGDVTSLAAKVSGYVTVVEVEDNQRVLAGDVLFRIDDRDYRAHLAQAEANLESAQARLNDVDAQTQLQKAQIRQAQAQRHAAMAERTLADKTHERNRKLIVHSAVSQALVDQTAAARTGAKAAVTAAGATVDAQLQRIVVLAAQREAALATIAQARAARELALIDVEHTVVRAPVSGVVGNRQVRVGRFVTPGGALLDVVPVENVWIVANFKETQLEHMRPGQRARITLDGYPSDVLEGVVDSFAPGSGAAFSLLPADNATGNFVRVVQRVPVKIRLAHNPLPGRIVPGLSARVRVEVGGGS
ncbi:MULTISPECIES: HlyD family secretion protein [unclassified Pseudomonas]|uniref:HlyD family secretion protein n=1 Tax=unclassified Pseudomonas TaxID=196821 RepID=UPI002449A915|nr:MULTISPECIES: HlyD family secretion protein [unclassified Pseudomonas]MDH0301784.1 HlyD family secretion protein [Pseudomonas sp. GD04091]MDH1983928.1 HlyD family secretion protein [Pseudomonas sp. GD03689]